MGSTTVIIVRHGETLWNRERRMQGQTDSVLSDLGRAQARALGARMARITFTALYTSDLTRAYDTARHIAEHSGHAIVADARLRERAFGVFEGLTRDEIARRYPQEYALFESRDPDHVIPGGESARQFMARSLGCLDEIAARHRGETAVVVTHGLVLDIVWRRATGAALATPRPLPLLNASLNFFRLNGSRWELEAWGDVSHLEDGAVTCYRPSPRA